MTATEKLIRFPELSSITGLSRSSVWRKENDEDEGFPKRIQLGTQSVAWRLSEILAWLDKLQRGARAGHVLAQPDTIEKANLKKKAKAEERQARKSSAAASVG